MKTYSWEEYYDKFFDWADSTRVRNLSYLKNVGDPDEVAEIIIELISSKVSAANRLLKRANDEKLQFKSEDLIEFSLDLDEDEVRKAMLQSAPRFTEEDIEDLYCNFEEDDIVALCHKGNLPLPEALRTEEDDDFWEDEEPMEPVPRLGFWSGLLCVLGINSFLGHGKQNSHCGHCDGDCANCPPHYGYRYGRWYYGHGHQYGCEFGGNKGDGCL